MNVHELYDQLNSDEPLSEWLGVLCQFLSEQVVRGSAAPDDQRELAYEMAGLLSARQILALPDDDPIKQILLLAGQLELPLEHRSVGATWDRLGQMVTQLS